MFSSFRAFAFHGAAVTLCLHATLAPAGAQSLSPRPASVSLTATVPSPGVFSGSLAVGGPSTLVRHAPTEVELSVLVGVGTQPASRVDVRLPFGALSDGIRVLVRNSAGAFEPLVPGAAPVTVADVPVDRATARHTVTFRIESKAPLDPGSLGVPMDYRLRIGSGEAAMTWRYTAPLGVGARR